MRSSIIAVVLALLAAPLQAQAVSVGVVLSTVPSPGRVVVVERISHRHEKNLKRGYRKVTLYYLDGRYYKRLYQRHPRVRAVVVYQRGGRYYLDERRNR